MSTALTRAHIVAQERLRALASRGVRTAWTGLAGYDEDDVDGFLSRVVPFTLAAQRQSILLADAYLARSLERPPVGVDAADVLASLRGDATPEQVYRRPFVTVWTALGNSTPYEVAVAAGLARAVSLAVTDVQLAHRATLQAVQDADPQIRGYRRVADAGACTYCSMIDGAFVRSADAMPLHPGCGCGLEPVQSAVSSTPAPADVAVREHGELGPVLGSPEHDFTSVADLD